MTARGDTLFKALAGLRNLSWELVGDDPLESRLRHEVSELDLSNRAQFPGLTKKHTGLARPIAGIRSCLELGKLSADYVRGYKGRLTRGHFQCWWRRGGCRAERNRVRDRKIRCGGVARIVTPVDYAATAGRSEPRTRFVYLSSIGVHGAASDGALVETSPLAPHSPYARSKALAERYLQGLVQGGDLDCRILRPPLVYRPCPPGNLERLMRLVQRGLPLPLGSVHNRRSLVGTDHLARAIRAVVEADSASRTDYLIADRDVISTPDIVRALARGLERPARLWPCPVSLLRGVGAVAGRRATIEQLIGNLEVDAAAFRRDFGDLQQHSTLDGLAAAARETA